MFLYFCSQMYQSMLVKIARVFSIVFHPIIMPTLGLLILFNMHSILVYTYPSVKRAIYIITFFGTSVLPLSFIPFFLYSKFINNIFINERKERVVPFLVTTLLYFFTYFLIWRFPLADFVKQFLLSCAVNIGLVTIISLKWKISVHMVGIGGIVGLLISLLIYENANVLLFLIPAIVVGGLLGTSRLLMQVHSPVQVYTGFIQGLIITILFLLVF